MALVRGAALEGINGVLKKKREANTRHLQRQPVTKLHKKNPLAHTGKVPYARINISIEVRGWKWGPHTVKNGKQWVLQLSIEFNITVIY